MAEPPPRRNGRCAVTRRAHGTGSITPLPGGGYQVAIEAAQFLTADEVADAVSEGLDVYAPNY